MKRITGNAKVGNTMNDAKKNCPGKKKAEESIFTMYKVNIVTNSTWKKKQTQNRDIGTKVWKTYLSCELRERMDFILQPH